VYHMETDLAYMNGTVPVDFPELINEPIKEVLRRTHPQDTIINIWKEIRIDFPTSVGGYHHVQAYHQFEFMVLSLTGFKSNPRVDEEKLMVQKK